MGEFTIVPAEKAEVVSDDWGQLTWFSSRKIGNSEEMTTGICRLKRGMSNPKHSHPNCTEVLTVLEGRIAHTCDADGNTVELGPGDTITVPAHAPHRATNIGDGDAVMHIAFSSADRKVQGE